MAKKKKGPKVPRLQNEGEHRKTCQDSNEKKRCVICYVTPRGYNTPTVNHLRATWFSIQRVQHALITKVDTDVVKFLSPAWKAVPFTCAYFLTELSGLNEVIGRLALRDTNNFDVQFLYASLTLATRRVDGSQVPVAGPSTKAEKFLSERYGIHLRCRDARGDKEPSYTRALALVLVYTSKPLLAIRELDKCTALSAPSAVVPPRTPPQERDKVVQPVDWISWRLLVDVEVFRANREADKRRNAKGPLKT